MSPEAETWHTTAKEAIFVFISGKKLFRVKAVNKTLGFASPRSFFICLYNMKANSV